MQICGTSFKDIDNYILENNSIAIAKELCNKINHSNSTTTSINNYYKNKQWCWNRDLKSNSEVMYYLFLHKQELDDINVSIESAVISLTALLYIVKTSSYVRLPNRFIAIRAKLSRKQVYYLFNILSLTDLLNIKINNNKMYVKINKNILLKDKYMIHKCKQVYKSNFLALDKIREEQGSVYFSSYCNRVFYLNWKQVIFGFTYYYNYMYKEYLTSKQRYEDIQKYGERTDIQYMEIPIHILKNVLNTTEEKILMYVRTLCKISNYVSTHNKVYIDSNNIEHYYNHEYKKCNLDKYNTAIYEEGRPIVTKYSIILHTSNFYNSNIYKHIINNEQEYREAIIEEIQKLNNCDYVKNETKTYKSNIINIVKINQIAKKYVGKLDKLRENSQIHTYNLSNIFGRYKVSDNLDKYSFKELITHTDRLLYYQESCKECDLNYYSKTITKCINAMKEMYNKYKNDKQIVDSMMSMLYKSDNCYYEYITS